MTIGTVVLDPTRTVAAICSLAMLTSCHMNPEAPQPQLTAATQANSGSWNSGNTAGNTNQGSSYGNQANSVGDAQVHAVAVPIEEAIDIVNPLRIGFLASQSQGDSGDALELDLEGGYRIGGYFEIGVVLGLEDDSLDDILEPAEWYVGPSARIYLVDRGQIQPWVGAALGMGQYDFSRPDPFVGEVTGEADSSFYRAGLGISFFASRWAALEASVTWKRTEAQEDSFLDTRNVERDDTELKFGISTFF